MKGLSIPVTSLDQAPFQSNTRDEAAQTRQNKWWFGMQSGNEMGTSALSPEEVLKSSSCELSPHFTEKAEKHFYLPCTLISCKREIISIEASALFCQHLTLHRNEVTSSPHDAAQVTELPFSSQNYIH